MTAGATSLSFLTWNLAMLERSAAAPRHWDQSSTEAVVRDVVLDLAPDVVLYQELPGVVPFVESHSMIPANPRSHSGNLATLIRNELVDEQPSATVVDGCALLTTFPARNLTIANVHLTAGKGAGGDRLAQLTDVIEASPTLPLVIIGDTNMRLAEAEALIGLGFSGDKPAQVTWDSRRNRFRKDMPEFSAYFTRWFASPGAAVTNVEVHNEPVEFDDRSFFVSDHFALTGQIVGGA